MRTPGPIRSEMENGRSDRIQELKYRLTVDFPQLKEENKTKAGNETDFPGDIHADIRVKDLASIISMINARSRNSKRL